MARGVGVNNTLQKFTLRNNSVGDKEWKQFSWVVRFKQNLKELDLRYNNIGNEGARKLSRALSNNTTMNYLHLSGNNIDEEILRDIWVMALSNRMGALSPDNISDTSQHGKHILIFIICLLKQMPISDDLFWDILGHLKCYDFRQWFGYSLH